jgi:hypothetical protein
MAAGQDHEFKQSGQCHMFVFVEVGKFHGRLLRRAYTKAENLAVTQPPAGGGIHVK